MGGGGGKTTTVEKADPWSGQQPYLTDIFSSAQGIYKSGMPTNYSPLWGSGAPNYSGFGADFLSGVYSGVQWPGGQQQTQQTQQTPQNMWPQYFGGDTVSDLNSVQNAGIQGQIDWANNTYPQLFNPMANTNLNLMNGGAASGFGNGLASSVLPSLSGVLSNAPSSQIGSQQLDLSKFMPGVNTSPITADPNAAINSMLSGQVDTQGLQQAINASNQPLIDNFNENIMPSIRGNEILTGQLGGSRGDIAGGLAASRLNRDMLNNANTLGYQAYQNAQNRQAQGAQLATNSLLQQSGLGLQGYGLAGQLAGQQAGLNLSADQARAGDINTQIGNLLGGGNLANSALSNIDSNAFRGLSLYPNLLSSSQMPFQNLQQAGGLLQSQAQNELDANIARWDYNQNLPMNMLNWYSGLVQGNNWGGSSTASSLSPTNRATGALGGAALGYGVGSAMGAGGAAAGASTGSMAGPYGALAGAALGYLLS